MMILVVLLVILLPVLVVTQKCDVSNINKADCGYIGITQDQCEAKSCCWADVGANSLTPWVSTTTIIIVTIIIVTIITTIIITTTYYYYSIIITINNY
jgi:hypothetical protein